MKICKNERRKEIRRQKREGTFVSKTSLESRSAKFLADALDVHAGAYLYDKVVYLDAHTPVEIFCTKHGGYFTQTPNSHLCGGGCFECGITATAQKRKYTHEEFVEKARNIHGNKYDYSRVNYTGCFDPVTVICPTHGPKTMIPAHHLQDRGCPECAKNGYRSELPATLYMLGVGNTTKVGITNIEVKERIRQISKSAGKAFILLHSWDFSDGAECAKLERGILCELRSRYITTEERYNGWTESFLDVDREWLVNHIEQLITQETNDTRPNIKHRETPTPRS